MIIDARTPHIAAVQLADLFEPHHHTVNDLILTIDQPEKIAVQTPAVKESPLFAFRDACALIARSRVSLDEAVCRLSHPPREAYGFEIAGDDITAVVTTYLNHLRFSIRIGRTNFETLIAKFTAYGLIQQMFAEEL